MLAGAKKNIEDGGRYIYFNGNICRTWGKLSLGYNNVTNTYDGTYAVKWVKLYATHSIDGVDTVQVCQGFKLYKGRLLSAISHNPFTAGIYTPKQTSMCRDVIRIPVESLTSNEGLTVLDDFVLIGDSTERQVVKFEI